MGKLSFVTTFCRCLRLLLKRLLHLAETSIQSLMHSKMKSLLMPAVWISKKIPIEIPTAALRMAALRITKKIPISLISYF